MASRSALLLALTPILAAPGCCSLASLFCGPDRSPWVPIAFETPRAALQTFLEAIRRANADVIYLCMAEDWKQELGVTGAMEANVAWDLIQEDNPYIHLAGTAAIPEQPDSRRDRGASYLLEVSGHRFRVDLVQLPYWVVEAEKVVEEDGQQKILLFDSGEYLETLQAHVQTVPTDMGTEVRIRLESDLYLDRLEDLVIAGVGREWKVRRVTQVEE